MKQIITSLFLCLVINIGLIGCAYKGIEHILMKEEPIIYLPFSEVTLHCPDVKTKASFKWTLHGRSFESYNKINDTNGAIQITITPEFMGIFICYATEEIEGQDVTNISSWNIDIARIEDWKSIEEVSPFSVDKHDPLTLTCDNIPRSLPAGQYSWYKQDESGDQVKESSRIAIDRKGSLHFVYIDMEDNLKGGEYKCSVSNRMLEEIKLGSPKRFYVEERKVEDKAPSLLFNGTDDYTVIGRSDVLECIFSGYPAPEIRWFDKEYKPITANEKYKIEKWGRMLTIENVQEEDEGYYRCIGENYIDKVESTVYLNVSSKPIFLNNNDEAIKVSNNTMIMNCSTRSADGESPSDPPIWLENGEYLPPDKLDSGKYELKQDYMELFVYNLTKPDDFRCFQCIVSNSIGVNYRTFCFTGNTTSDNVQSYGAQFEIASTRPILNRSSDVVSQINLALLMCVIFGVMVLFVVAGILSLVVFRRRRLKANKIQHNEFYTEVKQSEYGVDTNRRFSW